MSAPVARSLSAVDPLPKRLAAFLVSPHPIAAGTLRLSGSVPLGAMQATGDGGPS